MPKQVSWGARTLGPIVFLMDFSPMRYKFWLVSLVFFISDVENVVTSILISLSSFDSFVSFKTSEMNHYDYLICSFSNVC